jgi:hypothetical protein
MESSTSQTSHRNNGKADASDIDHATKERI